jgi:Leucine-rich repeat (LRR) protein
MKEVYTPERIKTDFLKGDLSKERALALLISLIESSEETIIRTKSIKLLKEIKIQNKKIFDILENLLLSDEDVTIRIAAVNEILNNYLDQGLTPLNWIIDHEKSPLVLKNIFNFFMKSKNSEFQNIKKKILGFFHKFSSKLGISIEESKFFFDLETIFAQNEQFYEINFNSYKYFQKVSDTKRSDPWLVINRKHIEILNLNYFNWKYIKQNEDIIDSFLRLYDLQSYLNSINKYSVNINNFEIPESIGKLTNLKRLILKQNNLNTIPQSISQLQNLKELDLSQNNFEEIPEVINSLKSLEKLNLKKNKINKISESMKLFLRSLKQFQI